MIIVEGDIGGGCGDLLTIAHQLLDRAGPEKIGSDHRDAVRADAGRVGRQIL